MPRYFLEVSYKGSNYSGFQSQKNTDRTIQAEIEKAFTTLHREKISLTGSSRTDAGVHAFQNYFHFDTDILLHQGAGDKGDLHLNEFKIPFIYKMNAILPSDIVISKLLPVPADAHCRFDAISREYKYYIYQHKDPFLQDRAFFFPYRLDLGKLQAAADVIKDYNDFTSFSKRNTQVKSFVCDIDTSEWERENGCIVFHVMSNRFLRGMVRALTATMLMIGRDKVSLDDFRRIIEAKDCTQASFAVPPQGLFLISVKFGKDYLS
jgi:tRNA pseudouridine38-40 synthase